jgi:hypothetical protein
VLFCICNAQAGSARLSVNIKSIAVPMKRSRNAVAVAQKPVAVDNVAPMARRLPSAVTRQVNHLYRAGDRLMLLSNIRVGKAASPCVILRLLPFEDAAGRERVVSEADLQAL